tara:strand:+ start:273 stop:572 length:300 start_codon:yes stop_codon:yes gene_type:complete
MKKLLIILFLINILFPSIPKTLKGQQNKSKINFHNHFTVIEKANICYVYGPKGNKIISVNLDKKNNLVSKTSYNKVKGDYIFIIHDNCEKIDCYDFIHR